MPGPLEEMCFANKTENQFCGAKNMIELKMVFSILSILTISLTTFGNTTTIPDEIPNQIQFRTQIALKPTDKNDTVGILIDMKGSSSFLFDKDINNDFLNHIDSIVGPITELIGTCCALDLDELSIFLSNGVKWSISFSCGDYQRGYLNIIK